MWRQGNPPALLVAMQTDAATVKNSLEIPKKIKNGTSLWPRDFNSGDLSEETQNTNVKEYMHPMFIAASFTIAKIWKQPKCPSVDEWIKNYSYNGMLLSHIKQTFTICNSMDGPRRFYAKWNKSVRERQIPYDFTYMQNLRNNIYEQINRNRLIVTENRLMVAREERD